MRALIAAVAIAAFVGIGMALADGPSGGGGGSGSCSGDIGSGCSQVTSTHLTNLLPVEQGGGGQTTGVSWVQPHMATFFCGSTTWVYLGLNAVTTNGTPAGAGLTGPGGAGVRCFIRHTSGTVSGNVAGITFNTGNIDARPDLGSRLQIAISTDSAVTLRRMWVGLTGVSTLSAGGGHVPPTGSVASGTKYIGFGYDPAVNSGKWVAATSDGTNESGTDTGVGVAASTFYMIDIDMSLWPTSVSMGVNGTYITKTTNLPPVVPLEVEAFAVTNSAAAVLFSVSPYTVWQ